MDHKKLKSLITYCRYLIWSSCEKSPYHFMIHFSKHRFVMHPLQKYPPSCNSTIFQFFRSGSSMLKRETSSLTRDSSRFSRTRESRESFINQMRTSSLETRESFANQTRAGSRDSVQESSSSGVSSDISHSR